MPQPQRETPWQPSAGAAGDRLDGAEEFRHTDQDENTSAISNSGMVTFFHDDTTTSGEHFEGVVTRIRLFDTALTPPQVAALTAIPPLFRDGFEAPGPPDPDRANPAYRGRAAGRRGPSRLPAWSSHRTRPVGFAFFRNEPRRQCIP